MKLDEEYVFASCCLKIDQKHGWEQSGPTIVLGIFHCRVVLLMDFSRTRGCCTCSRCGKGRLFVSFIFHTFSSILSIIIITSLFREDDILSNTNYLSDIWSSMIKIMYLNYRQICTIYTYTI